LKGLSEHKGDKKDFVAIDLAKISSSAELEKYGMEVLEFELSRRGVKSSGTLAQRAERLFLVKDLKREEIPKQFLAPSKYRRWFTHKKEIEAKVNQNRERLHDIQDPSEKRKVLDTTMKDTYMRKKYQHSPKISPKKGWRFT